MPSYNPSLFTRGAKATLINAYNNAPPSWIDRIATRVPSESSSEDHPWIGHAPRMQELTHNATPYTAMTDALYTLTNKTYVGGFEVKRTDLADDKVSGYAKTIAGLGREAKRYPNKLLADALINATSSTLGLDFTGQAFIGDSHTARGSQAGTLDNKLAGTGTTTAQVSTDIGSCFEAALAFQQENGEPFHEDITSVCIVAPALLRKPILEAVEASVISNTSNSQTKGVTWDYIFTGRLTASDANDWYFLVTSGPIMPLLFQEREALTLEALDSPEASDDTFDREIFKYKARTRCVVGYGNWQCAVKVVNT